METFRDSGAVPLPRAARNALDIEKTERSLLESKSPDKHQEFLIYESVCAGSSCGQLVSRCHLLCERFQERGRIADIDEVVRIILDPRYDTAHLESLHPAAMLQLGRAYTLRYGAVGAEDSDFDAAKSTLDGIVKLAENGSPFLLAASFRTFAHLYELRFDNNRKYETLDTAVDYARQALNVLVTHGPVERSQTCLGELAWYLSVRYKASPDAADLEESIRLHKRSLALSHTLSQRRHIALWRYGHALRLRFQLLNDPADFFKAEELLSAALAEAEDSQTTKLALIACELGDTYAARYKVDSDVPDLLDALRFYTMTSEAPASPAKDRLEGAVKGARLAMQHGYQEHACQSFTCAVGLLSQLAWLGLDTRKRWAKLKSLASHLSSDAAACAIIVGRPELAIQLLDEGRSVVWRTVLDIRADLTPLENVAPELHKELKELGDQLDSELYDIHIIPPDAAETFAQDRRRAAERWEELLDQARRIPEFSSFLKPLLYERLRDAASEGPVIILNISEYRSDALIFVGDEPLKIVPLDGLAITVCRQLAYTFEKAQRVSKDKEGCRFLEETIRNVAQRLWHGGIASVARALYQLRWSNGTRQRVWWVATDALSLLPIHCAGPYQNGEPGIPDLFVSSYTTTLAALIHARASLVGDAELQAKPPGLLAIAQPKVQGLPPLATAMLEIDAVKRYAPFTNIAVVDDGMERLWTCQVHLPTSTFWMHCCAHGHWNPISPLDSSIRFSDGSLTLAHIIHLDFVDTTEFAFLSACHTARQSIVLPDESMHLAAGLQIAGLKAVVASAWAMADSDGPRMAYWFYTGLRKKSEVPKVTDTAVALAGAVDQLRKMGAPMYRWAVFVHHGV